MRNIFDQYTQPENRLTHALVSALANERRLLVPFLKWIGVAELPDVRNLRITEQQVPGEVLSGEETDAKGIPDACMYTEDGWALLVETKVQAKVSVDQLRRHRATAITRGFGTPLLLVLALDALPKEAPPGVLYKEWRDVYAWFRRHARESTWARQLTEYFEQFEAKMVAADYSIRGTITMFDGFRFDDDHPYSYGEAKRLIRLLGDELQARKDLTTLGVDPKGPRRGAITGKAAESVWDFLPLKAARGAKLFTDHPHLTLAIKKQHASAAITVPNGVKGGFKKKLFECGEEGFEELLIGLEQRLRPIVKRVDGGKAVVYALQRHYRSQRDTNPPVDARLEADLRTVVKKGQSGTKYQPEWATAIYAVLTRKKSNIQLGFEVQMPYEAPAVRTKGAVDLFVDSWKAMEPVLRFVLD